MSMVSYAMSHFYSTLSFDFPNKICRHTTFSPYTKSFTVTTSASLDYSTDKSLVSLKTSNWQWKFKNNSININYEEHIDESNGPNKNILMMPSISDVSSVTEWRLVAKDIIQRPANANWRATIVDWPGLGHSDRPKLEYNADVMESFLVDLFHTQNSPIGSLGRTVWVNSGVAEIITNLHKLSKCQSSILCFHILCTYSNAVEDLVIVAGGHAATIAIRATKKGLIKPTAIAAVAPTWSGPLPTLFGHDSKIEARFKFLREILRAPAIGWMMYKALISNKKFIRYQYKSHVYADFANVTQAIIESKHELMNQKGARYAPAAFLTGLFDPVKTREEFLEIFAGLEGKVPVLVVSTPSVRKKSKAEMEALRGAKGVCKFVEVPGALLPHEEYPDFVANELYSFLQDLI